MEGKTVILSVLIMTLFVVQIQVEAKSCCPNTVARNVYNFCRFVRRPQQICPRISRCRIVSRRTCPSGFPRETLENSGDNVNEYCNLGCESSVCGALTTMENSDASEIVNEALEKCTKACSTLCDKGSNKTTPDQKIALDQSA